MKTLKLTCVILFSLIALTACNQHPEDRGEILEYDLSSYSTVDKPAIYTYSTDKK